MAKIYLLNVGANTGHARQARAPLFPDDSFEFVSFPDDWSHGTYPRGLRHYVSKPETLRTHADPDWKNLTYGDNCANPRASALLAVTPGDMLLFWALFWRLPAPKPGIFDISVENRRWCLCGALKVKHVISAETKEKVDVRAQIINRDDLRRAMRNIHVRDGYLPRRSNTRHDVVFVGDHERSALFDRAVDLGIYRDNGLLRRTIFSSDGRRMEWTEAPRWNSSLRTCRAVFDHAERTHSKRIEILQDAILKSNPHLRRLWF